MRLLHALMPLLGLACDPKPGPQPAVNAVASAPVDKAENEVLDGMIRISGDRLLLGQPPGAALLPGPGGPMPGGPMPGGPPPGPGGRGSGPPPIVARNQPHPAKGAQARPLDRWESTDGVLKEPQEVAVSAFRIDRTEVTRAAYQRFLVETGYRPPHVDESWAAEGWNWVGTDFPPGTGQHPVVLVSGYDAAEYCAWRGARLPTEAEWQLAVLGPGPGRRYPWGDAYDGLRLNHGKLEQPNFDDSDGFLTTSPVGSFPGGATPEGLQDGFGNAWEWTADHRFEGWSFTQATVLDGLRQDPHNPPPGLYFAVRGGSYFFDLAPNPLGERHAFLTEIRRKTSGFRCAADIGDGG